MQVAITGDVGAGKSSVCRMLASCGVNTVDADVVAKTMWQRPEIVRQASARWGDIYTKQAGLNTTLISKICFSNEEEYRFMCGLIHPPTMAALKSMTKEPLTIFEIPLLFEAGVPDWIDGTIYVTAPDHVRTARTAVRGWTTEELEKRQRWLMSGEDKKRLSHVVLDNDGTEKTLRYQVGELADTLKMASGVIMIHVTCPSYEDAEKLGALLVNSHLAASANITPASSIYRWAGTVHRASEHTLSVWTLNENRHRISEVIEQNHTYTLPCIWETAGAMSLKLRLWVLYNSDTENRYSRKFDKHEGV